MIMQNVYKVKNADDQLEYRLYKEHPYIREEMYCVRVSKIMPRYRADRVCSRLNRMVFDREGVKDRFQVFSYRRSSDKYVIMRRALVGDNIEFCNDEVD